MRQVARGRKARLAVVDSLLALLLRALLGRLLSNLLLGYLLLRHSLTSVQGFVTRPAPANPNSGRPPISLVDSRKTFTFLATPHE